MKFENPFIATPGPSHIPQFIFDAMNKNIHHRTAEFEEIFRYCVQNTAKFFGANQPSLIISGSGTSIMDAAVANTLSPDDKVIVLEFGKFSERFTKIATEYGCNIIRITSEYGTYPTVDLLATTLKKHPDTKAVFTCHSETSTGVLSPIADYARIISATNALFIVDSISSLSSTVIDQDRHGIDICLGVGHKGFMLPSGLAFVSLSGDKVWEALKKAQLPKFYINFIQESTSQIDGVSAWTPAIQLILGLKKTLDYYSERQINDIFESYQKTANYTHDRLQKLGLISVVQKGFDASPSVLAYYCDHVPKIITSMKEKGIIIANGQGSLHNKIFRIGNMGSVTLEMMTWILDNLEESIKDHR
ncbi:MAG: pyridoxal-phosphate-dependent aminotransferase family protein [Brevinema sp.]